MTLNRSLLVPLCVLFCFSGVASDEPPMELPEGFVSQVAAAPPLIRHPIMASLGRPGSLFVGDAAGTNLNKAGLEKQLPNRLILLTDLNKDGRYDRASVFADQMTFPQGGVWLDGSFYVASPPGIWKLTDTDGDGVADVREMIVGGFEYTGNGADVHGPFLHPNGRLYWCHGRKGHEVRQRDGTLVHSGLASGIWSCQPDGSDVRWHALSCADNPTEIDFTPEGEIVGTVNLYYAGPRGDTIVHWLRGGVYEREDQLNAIAGLPRTLEVMPVAHNFGHVAVSGCAFYRSGALDPDWRGNLFVAHFNTQRITRMEVHPDGASYRMTEREFLKLRNPDAHLTDILEDRDGSLLVVDTGGWFRIGCPSSLMAKPDVAGAIYRIRKASPFDRLRASPTKEATPWGEGTTRIWALARLANPKSTKALVQFLHDRDPSLARAAANALASFPRVEAVEGLIPALQHADPGVQLAAAHALGEMPSLEAPAVRALLRRLEQDLDRCVEHQVMFALQRAGQTAPLVEALHRSQKPILSRRLLAILDQPPNSSLAAADLLPLLDSPDATLARAAAVVASRHKDWMPTVAGHFSTALTSAKLPADSLGLLETAVKPWLGEPAVRELVSTLVESTEAERQRTAWRLLAAGQGVAADSRWLPPLQEALLHASTGDLPLVLGAVAKLRASELNPCLKQIVDDNQRSLALRLKALGASTRPGAPLPAESCQMLLGVLRDNSSSSARFEAARLLAAAGLTRDQMLQLAPVTSSLGPLELRETVKAIRSARDAEVGRAFAKALTKSPALDCFQESEIRTIFANLPPECFDIVAPALRVVVAEDDLRRRKLETMPALVEAKGRASEGRKVFETGTGACTTCHRVGTIGNVVGPTLSTIGQIRTPRDILESILFPSATIARDHEAYAFELAGGESLVGLVSRSLPESMVVTDASAAQRTLSRSEIASMQPLPTSLMPNGLDRALTEQELLDLVAYLRSCK
jgi:putative membrane-bound dehydrogenase-like protein